MFRKITQCRICGNSQLLPVVDLGNQYLTGIFPRNTEDKLTCGPLELVKCDDTTDESHKECCGLVQLRYSYSPDELYGDTYGYRSGLNRSMVNHLRSTVETLKQCVNLNESDLILDIGSNDGTLLSFYDAEKYHLVGIDPSGEKFRHFYSNNIRLIVDFFSARLVEQWSHQKARLITSIAMFYDLEDPLSFMREVYDVLDDEGVWHLEQSYLPAMLSSLSYDTICHEHLEYYALKQIKWLADRADLKIIKLAFNDINGGSFAVTLAKKGSSYREDASQIASVLSREEQAGLSSSIPYKNFEASVYAHREQLKKMLSQIRQRGETIVGYGASTKGNVILQFCDLTRADIPCIAEVNEDKFGAFTPGTHIPIVSEAEAHSLKPDYFFVLPWHFREGIVAREAEYLKAGGKLIFPLPRLEIVGAEKDEH